MVPHPRVASKIDYIAGNSLPDARLCVSVLPVYYGGNIWTSTGRQGSAAALKMKILFARGEGNAPRAVVRRATTTRRWLDDKTRTYLFSPRNFAHEVPRASECLAVTSVTRRLLSLAQHTIRKTFPTLARWRNLFNVLITTRVAFRSRVHFATMKHTPWFCVHAFIIQAWKLRARYHIAKRPNISTSRSKFFHDIKLIEYHSVCRVTGVCVKSIYVRGYRTGFERIFWEK